MQTNNGKFASTKMVIEKTILDKNETTHLLLHGMTNALNSIISCGCSTSEYFNTNT